MAKIAQSRNEILAVLKENKPRLQQEFPLHRLALFGSWARGDETIESDVDILVEVDPSIGLRFVTLAEQLELLLGRDIDLISHRAIKPSLWRQIQPDLIYV
ncbi:MAG: nucleotidyltransferase family protein [Caldilineaceae bacterium]|nr:nucleotidyltransferase family protein [Caldilineaceae bacterium]